MRTKIKPYKHRAIQGQRVKMELLWTVTLLPSLWEAYWADSSLHWATPPSEGLRRDLVPMVDQVLPSKVNELIHEEMSCTLWFR